MLGIASFIAQLLDLALNVLRSSGQVWKTLRHMSAVALGHHLPPKPPELSAVALATLAGVLAELYPDTGNLRRLLAWSQLDAKLIPLSDTAINRWHFTVRHAQAQGKLGLLVRLALEEYPVHTYLTFYSNTLNPENPHGQ